MLSEAPLQLPRNERVWPLGMCLCVVVVVVCVCIYPCLLLMLLLYVLQIRALTRGDVDEDAGDAALKLLADLTVPLPHLVELMQDVSLYEVETLMEDHIRNLVGWGIYSFVAAVEVSQGAQTIGY